MGTVFGKLDDHMLGFLPGSDHKYRQSLKECKKRQKMRNIFSDDFLNKNNLIRKNPQMTLSIF
jgi:hypothetical protein